MRGELLIAEFLSTPWALAPERLSAFAFVLARWVAGAPVAPEVAAQVRADAGIVAARRGAAANSSDGSIAVLPMYGVVTQRGNVVDDVSGPGSMSTQRFAAMFQDAVDDPSVKGVLIEVDSPGGSVYGVPELADRIYAARAKKPVYAVANSQAASAAYWLASQATKVYVTPSGEIGSVGVYAAHDNYAEAMKQAGVERTFISAGPNKVEGNNAQPLSPEAKAYMQTRIDDYYGQFTRDVARGRGVDVGTVRGELYGGGRVLGASAAKSAGMVDAVGTREQALADLATALKPKPLSGAALLRRQYG